MADPFVDGTGEKIRRDRIAAGLTQAEVAEKIGIQPETLCKIEEGLLQVSGSILGRILEALKRKDDELGVSK
jgi:transcriptional regulator with XRE-family HTH domain